MKFEIIIQGAWTAIRRFHRRLNGFSSSLKKVSSLDESMEIQGLIVINDIDEGMVNDKLLCISREITCFKKREAHPPDFHIKVRNLAYSEPCLLHGQFSEPFSPVPSLIIQPWNLSPKKLSDPRTIILYPYDAFGSGKHPTTVLCLQMLDRLVNDNSQAAKLVGKKILDFGCGTGILAIAAVKLGAHMALGVEIDDCAANAARKNVALNDLTHKVTIRTGSWEVIDEEYDLILANLVPSAIMRFGRQFARFLKHGGILMSSGFGDNQANMIKDIFTASGLTFSHIHQHMDWTGLTFSKRNI